MLSNSEKTHIIKLQNKKYRDKYGEYLVEGIKGVEAVLKSDREVVSLIYRENPNEQIEELEKIAALENVPTKECSKNQAEKIKTTSTYSGVTAVVKKREYELGDLINEEPIVCLYKLSDPGNLGTIIRSADWFGVNNILLSEESVEAHNEKVVRSSMGSFFNVNLVESSDIISDIKYLQDKNYEIVGLDTEGESLKGADVKTQSVLVFGSESHGLGADIEELLDCSYTIQGEGGAESLNVAVSAAITLFEIKK